MNSDGVLSWLKLSTKQYFAVLVISSILLFASDEVVAKIGLLQFRELAKTWIGVVWLLSLALLSADLFTWIYKSAKKKFRERKNLKEMQSRLHQLSEDEKDFLAGYFQNQTKTQTAAISNGTVGGLVAAKIVFRASSVSSYHTQFAYNIQPWAQEYLNKHPECLE